jgi:HSP20 family protein
MIFRRITGWPGQDWESPFDELERMRRQMDLLSDRLSKGPYREPFAGVFPLMNVTEDDEGYYIRAELPGINSDDLDISVTGDSLSIAGERKIPVDNQSAKYHRRERESGKFSRIISLPGQIDTEKVKAACADGVLTITLPKAEVAKPKKITVKGS